MSLLSLKTSQAKSFKNIVFKNNASGLFFPFHMVCLFLFTRKSSQKRFNVTVPRPRYMCTPTEVHTYPDRGTCVSRSGYDNFLTFFRAFSELFQMFFRAFSDDFQGFFRCFLSFQKAPFISSSAPCVS